MKSFTSYRMQSWLPIILAIIAAVFSVGCTSSRSSSNATSNPLAAYDTVTGTSTTTNSVIGDGTTITPGSLNSPVITVPEDGSTSINGHDNAPLLDNTHPGWQQSNCLSCHNDTTNNPDHNYSDDSLCYLCHGTNGMPGMSDSTPPVLSSVVVSPNENTVTISWKSDENCVSRLILKTTEGDKIEFPVSTTYTTSHKRTISGLQYATTYYYELVCTDKSGNKTSTSSFSSNLMFQTPEKVVTPVVSTTGTSTGTDTEEEGDNLFKTVEVTSTGQNVAVIRFEVNSTPVARTFNWYIYRSRADARNKKNWMINDWVGYNSGKNVYTDSTGALQGVDNSVNYFARVAATMEDGSRDRWSNIVTFKFKL